MLLAAACGAWPGAAPAQPDVIKWTDPSDDASLRRTDPGADGPVMPGCNLPDVQSVTISGWEAVDPKNDPYTGWVVDPKDAHLFRLQLTFSGLIGPPGTLGLNGEAYDPFRFGASPVYGFLDIDIDHQKNSGGVLGAAARQRYLANVGRFGRVPDDSLGERAARSAEDYDDSFYSGPQYERSGADWDLAFCGCFNVIVLSEDGNADGVFDPGETWVVRGRFFERASGYVEASDAFGGSGFGRYDPKVNLEFHHNQLNDTTTVTLVYALDMAGAAELTGQEEQQIDLNVANQTSIVEGLQDIIDNADNLFGPVEELTKPWKGRNPFDVIDPTEWTTLALFGTAYLVPDGALYAWTDTGFDEQPGDVDGDGMAGDKDLQLVIDQVYKLDGTAEDTDGEKNGRVAILAFGLNFSVYDVNGDGWIDSEDLWVYGQRADLNRDGVLDIFDFLQFQNLFISHQPEADFNLDGVFDIFDFLSFVNAFNH